MEHEGQERISEEEAQLDLLIAAVTNYNHNRELKERVSLAESEQRVHHQRIRQNQQPQQRQRMQQQHNGMQESTDEVQEFMEITPADERDDLSVEEIQRILELPSYAVFDITKNRFNSGDQSQLEHSPGGMGHYPGGLEHSPGGLEDSPGGLEDSPGGVEHFLGGPEVMDGGHHTNRGSEWNNEDEFLQLVESPISSVQVASGVPNTRQRSVSTNYTASSPESGISECSSSPCYGHPSQPSPEQTLATNPSPNMFPEVSNHQLEYYKLQAASVDSIGEQLFNLQHQNVTEKRREMEVIDQYFDISEYLLINPVSNETVENMSAETTAAQPMSAASTAVHPMPGPTARVGSMLSAPRTQMSIAESSAAAFLPTLSADVTTESRFSNVTEQNTILIDSYPADLSNLLFMYQDGGANEGEKLDLLGYQQVTLDPAALPQHLTLQIAQPQQQTSPTTQPQQLPLTLQRRRLAGKRKADSEDQGEQAKYQGTNLEAAVFTLSPAELDLYMGRGVNHVVPSGAQPLPPKEEAGGEDDKDEDGKEYFCSVCLDKAGKHSYYGGQVCASCRAFFRRSVQSKYYELFRCKKQENCEISPKTRKSCQFCRFKKCLSCGMKVSWVLSDDERNRRFNKFNKMAPVLLSNPGHSLDRFNKGVLGNSGPLQLTEPYMSFTIEEGRLLGEVQEKFQVCRDKWMFNLLVFNKEAISNFLLSAFHLKTLEYKYWKVIEDSFEIYFVKAVVPQFKEVEKLPFYDRSLILSGDNPRIAHAFKTALCLDPWDICGSRAEVAWVHEEGQEQEEEKEVEDVKPCDGKTCDVMEDSCPIEKTVKEMTSNKQLMNTLGLEEKFSRLNLETARPELPKYKHLFHANWANNPKAEERHKEISRKISCWPYVNNKYDKNLSMLMTVILLFHPDYSGIVHRDQVEQLQLKYILLLQRYIKSRLSVRQANKKFLEGMLMISYAKEMWELSKLHVHHQNGQQI